MTEPAVLDVKTEVDENDAASENWAAGLDDQFSALQAQWKKINESAPKNEARELFNQNKYGMFIHWGLYSIPAGIWKGEKMEEGGDGPRVAEWVMRRKEIPRAEYEKLAQQFNPVDFDADTWAGIAKAAGMKYMVITAKHHEGFALFDSKVDAFNAVAATPFGRDIICELSAACERAGIAFGVYYSHALDWRDGGDGGMKDYCPDTPPKQSTFQNFFDPAPIQFDDYIVNKSLPQVCELMENVPNLAEIWFDTPLYIPPKHSFAFYKTVYDYHPNILVTQRVGNGFGDIGTPGDNVIPEESGTHCWEGIATTNNSWGYNSYDDDWKTPEETLFWLIATVSKGGNFLLNVGPKADGLFPEKTTQNLLAVGEWLQINGDAIYDSKPWKTAHEGPGKSAIGGTIDRHQNGFSFNFTAHDFWFTQKGDRVYAIAFNAPDDGVAQLVSFKDEPVTGVRMLGCSEDLSWRQTDEGLLVTLPDCEPSTLGYVLELCR